MHVCVKVIRYDADRTTERVLLSNASKCYNFVNGYTFSIKISLHVHGMIEWQLKKVITELWISHVFTALSDFYEPTYSLYQGKTNETLGFTFLKIKKIGTVIICFSNPSDWRGMFFVE